LRNVCAAIAKQLRSDHKMIAQRLQGGCYGNCRTIVNAIGI
jgi:hypothetical protein